MTPRERDCFEFIKEYLSVYDCSPSIEDIAEHMGLASKSSAHRIVNNLAAKGWITHTPYRARTIRIADEVEVLKMENAALQKRIAELEARL